MEYYVVSHDDRQVAFSLKDQNGISHGWLAPTDHRSSPRQLASATSQSARRTDDEHPYAVTAYPLDGGPSLRLCKSYCVGRWDISGKFFYLKFPVAGDLNTYMLPVSPALGIPNFPAGGIATGADLKADNRVLVIPQQIESAAGPNHYSYTRQNTRRNICRIPLPE